MKYAELNLDSHKIEFFNSLFGNERVLVNETEVSNKFSLFGTKHRFDLDSDNYTLSSSFKALGRRELDLKLAKNQRLIKELNINLNPGYSVSWGAVAIIIGIIIYSSLKN